MAFKPGKPKTGGRQKGTPNKKTQELMLVLEEHEFDPGAELIFCYRQAKKIFQFRKRRGNLAGALVALKQAAEVAEDIAQFTYPKKKAIEHSGEVGVKTFADFIAAGAKEGEEK